MNPHLPRLLQRTTLCCVVGVTGVASAAEWSMQPRLQLSADYNTNRWLDSYNSPSNSVQAGGTLDLARASARQRLALRSRFKASRYDAEHDVLDSNDGGIDLRLQQFGLRSTLGFNAAASSDSTLTSEFEDTGIVQGSARRRTLNGGADFSVRSGERSQLQTGVNYVDVTFEGAEGTGLTPYKYPSAFLAWSLEASERSQLRVTASAARLDIATRFLTTENYFGRLGWRTNLSERWTLDLTGGFSRTSSGPLSDDGTVFSAAGDWSGERSTFSILVSRDLEPSAAGYMVTADSARATWRWDVGERSSLSLQALHASREELSFFGQRENREYSTLLATFGWKVSEQLSLELRGGSAYQYYGLSEVSADGEQIALSFNWSPRKFARSR